MRTYAVWIAALGAGLAPAGWTQSSGTTTVPTARFEFAAADNWGGQPLLAPRAVTCTTQANVTLGPLPGLKNAHVYYGAIPLGQKQTMALALVRSTDGQVRVYLDANRDGTITAQEGQLLQRGAVAWPACADDLSARLTVGLTTASRGQGQSVARSAVVWVCQAPNVVFFAWQGFLRGKLEIDGGPRDAFLVDANSNGVFGDQGDIIWIDLDGDGQLEAASEEFAVAPLLRLGSQLYRLSITPQPSAALTGKVGLGRWVAGLGKAKIVLPSSNGAHVNDMVTTLVSELGDVTSATTLGQDVELPAGRYYVSDLMLQVASRAAPPWKYTFSSTADAEEDKPFPLKIARDATTEVLPLRKLTLDARVEGERRPGATLQVVLSARSDAGLGLTRAERPGAERYGDTEDYAHIVLVDPSGTVVATAQTGFS